MAAEKPNRSVMKKAGALLSKVDALLTRRNQIIFFVLTVLFVTLSCVNLATDLFPSQVSTVIYVCAALCFFPSCTLWGRAIYRLYHFVLIPFALKDRRLQALKGDYRLLTVVFSLPGLSMGVIFAVLNIGIAVYSHSGWHGALATYYMFMFAMRLIAAIYAKSIYLDHQSHAQMLREWKVYRTCGILLTIMSVALLGAVVALVKSGGGKRYPGFLIYAVAAYTFYKLIMSLISVVRAHREHSPLAMALRCIGHSEALVSLLSLQTAMFATFGSGSREYVVRMNGLTGVAVCLIALAIGLYMVQAGKKKVKVYNQTPVEKEKLI